ncbi:MAG TPA: glucosamine-6-phosphate deaminase [Pirellulaceae bacterium]|nr:glucosamine-6-phosphate deaminase [Pirellulaceae bacterium]
MRVIVHREANQASRAAADWIARCMRAKPDCVLGLATGSTPLAVYRELIRMHVEEGLDFSQITTFNLDEYVGLQPSDPHSYRYFMEEHLFRHVNLRPQRTFVPDGRALDLDKHCQAYERQIRETGGIDIQLLGIGSDGHIAFNEPGSSLGSRTRVKTLTRETRRDNARFFDDPQQMPRLAITVGVGTILDARQVLLLAAGEHKAQAVAAAIEGPVTAQVTASALQLHREVVVMLDESAASQLQRREYYDEVEQLQRDLEQSRQASQLPATFPLADGGPSR